MACGLLVEGSFLSGFEADCDWEKDVRGLPGGLLPEYFVENELPCEDSPKSSSAKPGDSMSLSSAGGIGSAHLGDCGEMGADFGSRPVEEAAISCSRPAEAGSPSVGFSISVGIVAD